MKYLKLYVSGILAGASIAFGGVVFLSLEHKVLGALFFTVGLFSVCSFGFHLYTGKICYVFQRDREYALGLPLIWLGNWTGAVLVALLAGASRIGPALQERAAALCETKLSDSFLSLFILGLFCDIFIYIAVEGFASITNPVGKYLALFFGVTVFILSGFEHCVADMFYFAMAGIFTGRMVLSVIIITLGNSVGGVLLPEIRRWLAKER